MDRDEIKWWLEVRNVPWPGGVSEEHDLIRNLVPILNGMDAETLREVHDLIEERWGER